MSGIISVKVVSITPVPTEPVPTVDEQELGPDCD